MATYFAGKEGPEPTDPRSPTLGLIPEMSPVTRPGRLGPFSPRCARPQPKPLRDGFEASGFMAAGSHPLRSACHPGLPQPEPDGGAELSTQIPS
jgi:hypothetical protein